MSIKKILILGFLGFFSGIYAQKLELGKVSVEELQEKRHPIDSSASAAILFKKARTTFSYTERNGFVITTEFTVKLKIYKKEGLKWANYEIPYYVGYKSLDDESISISKAQTYNLENGKIIKDKVTSDGKFNEQINEYWKTKSITFPNVKVGSIIEFKYVLKSPNLSTLPDFQYQYNIPVNFAEYVTEIPSFYIYKGMKIGFVAIEMDQELENVTQNYVGKYQNSNSFSYNQIKTVYKAKNIPAFIPENYVNNINNYYAKLTHELERINMPNEKPKQLASTWESVSESIYNEKEFGKELEKFNYFLNDVSPLVVSLNANQQKLERIFDFVKNRMNWNGRYGYFVNKGVEVAYQEKTGNVAEINLMLVAMLRMAGIDANPVLISTRENGVATFPNRSCFNYVIASVTIDNNQLLLDATDKMSNIGILPIRDLNGTGRLIRKDNTSIEVNLTPKKGSNKTTDLIASITSKGNVEGKVREQYFDYNAFQFRDSYSNIAKDSYLEKLESKYNSIEVLEYDVINKLEWSKPVIETYTFKDNNSMEIIGDKMYISPLLFLTKSENPFRQEKREYPVDFGYPINEKINISIEIPEGYIVESLPAVMNIATLDNIGTFKYIIGNVGSKIQLSITADLNTAVVPAKYYDILKDFFKKMIDKQNEKIVLKRA